MHPHRVCPASQGVHPFRRGNYQVARRPVGRMGVPSLQPRHYLLRLPRSRQWRVRARKSQQRLAGVTHSLCDIVLFILLLHSLLSWKYFTLIFGSSLALYHEIVTAKLCLSLDVFDAVQCWSALVPVSPVYSHLNVDVQLGPSNSQGALLERCSLNFVRQSRDFKRLHPSAETDLKTYRAQPARPLAHH